MTKQDYYRQSGMATREYRPYQTDTFPLSVHKTIFRLDSTLPQGARCNVLYAHWHEEVDIFDWIFYPKDTNARFFKKKTRLFSKRKIG